MGDVGIVQKSLGGNQHFHMGLIPQRMRSFTKTLDMFLQMPGTVLSSIVPAEKDESGRGHGGADRSDNITASVMKIIGRYLLQAAVTDLYFT